MGTLASSSPTDKRADEDPEDRLWRLACRCGGLPGGLLCWGLFAHLGWPAVAGLFTGTFAGIALVGLVWPLIAGDRDD